MYMYSPEHYPDPTAMLAVARASACPRFGTYSGRERQMVYICSPFDGDPGRDRKAARRWCRVAAGMGRLPIAPKLFLPQFLSEEDPDHRILAEIFDRMLLAKCRQLWVFGGRVNAEMAEQIGRAIRRGMAVRYFTPDGEECFPYGGTED